MQKCMTTACFQERHGGACKLKETATIGDTGRLYAFKRKIKNVTSSETPYFAEMKKMIQQKRLACKAGLPKLIKTLFQWGCVFIAFML